MLILGIETSCDETAVAVVECAEGPIFRVLSSVVSSQIDKHAPFGGVVPNIAKREHETNLVPVLIEALQKSSLLANSQSVIRNETTQQLKSLLTREPVLWQNLLTFLNTHKAPKIDAIAVTQGPGLEPALWVGLNFGKALALAWQKPLISVNHMEGHVVAVLLQQGTWNLELGPNSKFRAVEFPAVALLVSGGHTELVLMHDWRKYELLGQTRDDAVGEAFDKVARLLGLPYPGGPEISKLAEQGRPDERISLPRPMLRDNTLDFSYSGLKTAVLYLVRKLEQSSGHDVSRRLSEMTMANIALEFENAATEVLVAKTLKAVHQTNARTLIVGGGVAANKRLRNDLTKTIKSEYPDTILLLPDTKATGDNAAMIAAAGYLHADEMPPDPSTLTADGNLRLAQSTTPPQAAGVWPTWHGPK